MEEINISQIKERTTSSIIFLTLRNFGIQAISTLGFFLLTLLLGTGEVGLFSIVAESVAILGYFSDVGLASALIQQKDQVSVEELRTTFFIQQILVLLGLTVISIIYFRYSSFKSYGPKEFWILVSLCFSFAAASLKTIPSVLLERKLNFKLLSTIDIIENTLFYAIAVIFAFAGFGVYSYAIATFIRSLVGLVIIYKISPWPIGISFSRLAASKLFKYGIPFQLNSFIAVAKDRLSTLFVSMIIGRESTGIIAWAQKGTRMPLSFMDAIMKVTFPTFSRMQDREELLKNSIEKSLFYIALFVFPALAGTALVAGDIINIIPHYSKWLPALAPLNYFVVSAAIASITTPLTNAFNAVGKIKTTTMFMIMWTLLTWIFYPSLSWRFGYLGTAYASLIVGSSSFLVWYFADKYFKINTFRTIQSPLIATILMTICLLALSKVIIYSPVLLAAKIVVGVLIYVTYNIIFSKREVIWFLEQIKWLPLKK